MNIVSKKHVKVLKILENEGRSIYKHSKFFKTLSNVMEHPETQKLLEEDIESTLLFLSYYHRMKDTNLSAYQKISVLKRSFDDSDTRHSIVRDWTRLEQNRIL
jgi:hypothetical protein